MLRNLSTPNKRIVERKKQGTINGRSVRPTRTRRASDERPDSLSVRLAEPQDDPWLTAWLVSEGLPRTRSRRARSILLIKDGQRVGHLSVKQGIVETSHGREPVVWIISLFLIPSVRNQGIMVRFGELLSRDLFPSGKIAAHVASENTRVVKLLDRGGWERIRTTGKYIEFMLELKRPFHGTR